jgi:hypothetical protein
MINQTKLHLILFFFMTISGISIGQPYLYKDGNHTKYTDPLHPLSRYYKINLADGSKDTVYYYRNLITDNTQTWIIEGERFDFIIVNPTNKNLKLRINFTPEMAVYSRLKYKLFFTGTDNNGSLFAVINCVSGKRESAFRLETSHKYGQMFLSSDENKFYLPFYDTTSKEVKLNKLKLAVLSTSTNKITRIKDISEYGIPGADSYYLVNGRKGKGIIESRFDTEDNYFTIYNFDKDSASPTIFYHGNADSYSLGDGKYLMLAEKEDSQVDGIQISTYTGTLLLYDVFEQKLVQTLNLPPNGEMVSADGFSDNLYYFDNLKGTVITLNINSLLSSASK